jgi:hypothetical protein
MEITFEGASRGNWLNTIVANSNLAISKDETINLIFNSISSPNEIEPFHFVLLACFIYRLETEGYIYRLDAENAEVFQYLEENLHFYEDVEAQDNAIFNLWKITNEEKESYSQQIHVYLRNSFFQNKDLSAIKNSLLEVYYNIFDHAEANGNAYSFIKYNETTQKLYVAICDFGIGIASSIRRRYNVNSDKEAILKAVEIGVTVQSKEHNRGFGLDNILSTLSTDDRLRIISNSGFLYAIGQKIRTFDLDFCFNGTLIYYELSIAKFEDLEINEIMTLDF